MPLVLEQETTGDLAGAARFLFNVQTWYFARHAENLKRWKDAVDGIGNPLLDTTIIPFRTEIVDAINRRSRIPFLLFGGKKLGMNVGRYVTATATINNLFGMLAQAFGIPTPDGPFGAPIPGLWSQPAGQ